MTVILTCHMYSGSVVLSAIRICSLESQIIGKTTYIIIYLISDFMVLTSSGAVGLCQFTQKPESVKTSKMLVFSGSKISP